MKEFIKLSFKSIDPMYFVIYWFLGFFVMALLYMLQLEFLDINIPLPLFIISYIFYPFSKYMWDSEFGWLSSYKFSSSHETYYEVGYDSILISLLFWIFELIFKIALKLFILAIKLSIPFITAIIFGPIQCISSYCEIRRESYEEENNYN